MDGSLVLQVTWFAIHVMGLGTAWMVRKEASGYRQRWAYNSFFVCLPMVALITVVGQFLCLTTWPLSAGTLGVMIVTAVVDFGPRAPQVTGSER